VRNPQQAVRSAGARLATAIAISEALNPLSGGAVPVWLDMQALVGLTGLSESSIRRMERDGGFPPLRQIGPRRRGLTLQTYVAWAEACQQGTPSPPWRADMENVTS
jgi:predicted DNA-binding transcriptional regulator AlpA